MTSDPKSHFLCGLGARVAFPKERAQRFAMSPDLQRPPKLQLGQVLCAEIVDPAVSSAEATPSIDSLCEVVRNTDAFRGAHATGKLVEIPLPKGLALIFTSTFDAPVRCAIQIASALRNHPELKIRMGIHRGPIGDRTESSDNPEAGGAALRVATRVMECGDAGHILLTRQLAESLSFYRHWQPHLHHLGEFELKGESVSLVNLHTGEAGRGNIPAKLHSLAVPGVDPVDRPISRQKLLAVCAGLVAFAVLVTILFANKSDRSNAMADRPIAPEKSIAVLPFENITANPDTAIFTDGIHDEILTNLARVADLKVISRTSVIPYKTGPRNLREIGSQLGVAHVVEGSVQHVGDRVRVTAQLIDARTDTHLWAQTYDRVLADIFAIQSEIAQTITEQLKVQLSPEERAALAQSATTDLMAERLFRQAWQLITSGSNPDAKANLMEAIPLIEEAIVRDPKFLRAYHLLATAHLDLYWQGFDHASARRDAAQRVIEQAVRINPDAGDTHLAQATLAYHGYRDYDRARAELELARKTLPNNAVIYILLGAMDRRQGRWNEAERNFARGIELDPRNFRFLIEGALTYQARWRYSEAAHLYRRALEVTPGETFARTQLAAIPFLERGDSSPLRAEVSDIIGKDPAAATGVANALYYTALADRDPHAVTRALQVIRPEGLRDAHNNSLWARDWFIGLAARTFGEEVGARSAFTAARAVEEQALREEPHYAPAWSRLGLIEAALGNKENAIRAGRRACELLPMSADTWDGPSYRVHLALIYLWTGEKDLALEELAAAAQTPGGVHYGELKHYPHWDGLRGDPRFEKIVSALAPLQGKN